MSADAGFSLVEILISLVIFSAVVLGLAGLAFQVARRSTRATDQAYVMSLLLSRVDRATTIPYDSLPNIAGCDTVMKGTVRVVSCTSFTTLSQRLKQVRVIVRTTMPGGRPDTVSFQRALPRVPIPLR